MVLLSHKLATTRVSVLLLFCSCLCAIVIGPLAGDAAAQPSVRFVSSLYSVVEGNTSIQIGMVISEPPAVTIIVPIILNETTATPNEDYFHNDPYASFEPAGSDTAYATIQIYDDAESEGPETLELHISTFYPSYVVGSIPEAQLTIIDDEAPSLTAHFEVDEDVPLDPYGRLVFAVGPDVPIEIDVVVDDLPPGGGSVNIATSQSQDIQMLIFVDNPMMTLNFPPLDIPLDEDYVLLELEILNPAGQARTGSDNALFGGFSGSWAYDCLLCLITHIFNVMINYDCEDIAAICDGYECPDKVVSYPGQPPVIPLYDIESAADLEILRRYRDEVLAGSPVGGYYTQLYEDQSLAIMTAILQRPTLIHRVGNVWELWLPAVEAQVDGLGEGFTITGSMQSALLDLMDEIEELADPDLAELVADFRVELDLENVAGTTAADLQEEIETNPMETERASWGDVKSIYGERK
jgi:hypothetical protein